jgi:hypothetical protein
MNEDIMETNAESPNESQKGRSHSATSMVLGICSIVFSWLFELLTLPASIVGLVFGIISLKRNYRNRGMAVAGVICSVIGLLASIASLIVTIYIVRSMMPELMDMVNAM